MKTEDTQEETPIINSKRHRTPPTVNGNVTATRPSLKYLKEEQQEETDSMSSKRKQMKEESNTIKYDNSLVGSKVKVWWPYYGRFYEGVIASFDHVKGKHKVYYVDGDVEDIDLRGEHWEFVGDVSVKNEETLTKTSSLPKVKESRTTLPKTTPSSSKVGEGNSIWPTEGTLHHQAIKSTLRCLSQMLDEGIHAGVTIITADGSLKAHKSILSASSLVFQSMFQDEPRDKVSTVEMKEMTSESCMALLSFLYGSINQEAFFKHRLDLLGAANKYDIVDLKDACEESLLEDINPGNVLGRLEQAWLYKLDKLKKGCFTYLLDSKIYGVREDMNEFLKGADRGLLAEMFQEVLAILKRN